MVNHIESEDAITARASAQTEIPTLILWSTLEAVPFRIVDLGNVRLVKLVALSVGYADHVVSQRAAP